MEKSNSALRSFVDRIENLEDQRDEVAESIKDLYTEASSAGYDRKALREIIRLRKQDKAKREEHEAIVDSYKLELGMLVGTPLGDFATRKAG